MTQARSRLVAGPGTLTAGAALFLATVAAWLFLFRDAAMPMPRAIPSLAEAAVFTAQWGVMMAAMMLPSAAPMILLYGTVRRRLSAAGEQAIPVALFAGVYLIAWLLLGLPVYAGYVSAARLSAQSDSFAAITPFIVAGSLVLAGLYQLSNAKRVCLRYCEAPLPFLMRRWRAGYAATFRIAVDHAAWCVGCCWALMVILVVAGAMSMPWVLAIASAVFVEKVLPGGWHTARIIGIGLVLLGITVALRPELAHTLSMPTPMPMR